MDKEAEFYSQIKNYSIYEYDDYYADYVDDSDRYSTFTSIDIGSVITDMEAQLEALGTGELFGMWFQSLFVGLTMNAISICIMLVIYGRMIEVYLTTSVGPIPLATMTNRDWSHTGQNYLKSLFALAFHAFLIMVCVGIYSVLVQSIATDGNISGAIWACTGYTVQLCFALFKT